MNELSWTMLASFTGASTAVAFLTEWCKRFKAIKGFPTQLLSYILACLILYPAMFFTGQLTLEVAVLILFQAVAVSCAANGYYQGYLKLSKKEADGDLLIDTSNPGKDVYRLDIGSFEGLSEKKKIVLSVKPGKIIS